MHRLNPLRAVGGTQNNEENTHQANVPMYSHIAPFRGRTSRAVLSVLVTVATTTRPLLNVESGCADAKPEFWNMVLAAERTTAADAGGKCPPIDHGGWSLIGCVQSQVRSGEHPWC